VGKPWQDDELPDLVRAAGPAGRSEHRPERVDVYFILRILLGKGGMGAAYLADMRHFAHQVRDQASCWWEMTHHPMIIRPATRPEAKARVGWSARRHRHSTDCGVLEDGSVVPEIASTSRASRAIATVARPPVGRWPLRKAANFIVQLCWALQHAA